MLVLRINSWQRCSHASDDSTRWLQISPSFVHLVWAWTLNGWDLLLKMWKWCNQVKDNTPYLSQTCYLSHTEPEELSQNGGTLEDQEKELEMEPEEFHRQRRELIWLLPVESAEPRSHGGLKDHSSVQTSEANHSLQRWDLDPPTYCLQHIKEETRESKLSLMFQEKNKVIWKHQFFRSFQELWPQVTSRPGAGHQSQRRLIN